MHYNYMENIFSLIPRIMPCKFELHRSSNNVRMNVLTLPGVTSYRAALSECIVFELQCREAQMECSLICTV